MKTRKIIICLLMLCFYTDYINAQNTYPVAVEKVLKQTPKNRGQLEKVIAHYKKTDDMQKLKAAYFLIGNMDIHSSYDINWVDGDYKKVRFNELNYNSMDAAVAAFNELKTKYAGIHPVQNIYRDIDKITATYLIDNIDRAFIAWKSPFAKGLSFNDFCEYLLPYRISVEPLQNWRGRYEAEFKPFYEVEKGTTLNNLLINLAVKRANLFYNSWGDTNAKRKEPLPRLGALNLLLRKKGMCEDIAGMAVFSLRAMGIATSIDFVPYWATSANRHYFNVALKPAGTAIPFDISTLSKTLNIIPLRREPAKVIRTTYSKKTGTLASIIAKEQIPEGFLRTQNYIDVTKDYWETANLDLKLSPNYPDGKIVYACVFNGGSFKPAWWTKSKSGTAVFNQMPKGVVYLPTKYQDHKNVPCGNPVAFGYHNTLELSADIKKTRTVAIKQQENYLMLQANKRYRLFYYKNGWKMISQKTAMANSNQLIFENVPNNALLILIPEYSKKQERPFIITSAGERVWF